MLMSRGVFDSKLILNIFGIIFKFSILVREGKDNCLYSMLQDGGLVRGSGDLSGCFSRSK